MERSYYGVERAFILCVSLILLPFSSVEGQSEEVDVEKAVTRAIEAGNASKLSGHFTQKVDLSTPDTDDVFSKAQAEQILKDFFQEHPPEKLVLEHQGTSKLKDRYHIGKLVTEKDKFRLTYFMKKVDSRTKIKKLQIEPYDGDL
ncbi:MAG: DUF4783 domain-containing protein [Flavobacteriales bacterium]